MESHTGSVRPSKRGDPRVFNAGIPVVHKAKKAKKAQAAADPRGRNMWTKEEVANLKQGQAEFGHAWNCWALTLHNYAFNGRTAVDLKDKWRLLQKAAKRA